MTIALTTADQIAAMKIVGVTTPAAGQPVDADTFNRLVKELSSGDASNVPAPRLPKTVLQNAAGERFLLDPITSQLTPVTEEELPAVGAVGGDTPTESYLPMADIRETSADSTARDPISGLISDAAAAALLESARHGSADDPAGGSEAGEDVPEGDGGGTDDGSRIKDYFESLAKQQGKDAIGSMLATAFDGGPLTPSRLLDSVNPFAASGRDGSLVDAFTLKAGNFLFDQAVGQVMGMATTAVMEKFFDVDDESNTMDHAAAKAAEVGMGHLQSLAGEHLLQPLKERIGLAKAAEADPRGFAQKISSYFFGSPPPASPTSTASIAVGRVGFPDTAAGFATSGMPTVLVNGQPALREFDTATMNVPNPGETGLVTSGNDTVLTGGQRLSGEHHTALGTLGTLTRFVPAGSPNVFMSPVGIPVVVTTGNGASDGLGAAAATAAQGAATLREAAEGLEDTSDGDREKEKSGKSSSEETPLEKLNRLTAEALEEDARLEAIEAEQRERVGLAPTVEEEMEAARRLDSHRRRLKRVTKLYNEALDELRQEVAYQSVQLGLDIGDAFDPTPTTGLAKALHSAVHGEYVDAALGSISALLPYYGDAVATPLKRLRHGERLNDLIETARELQKLKKTIEATPVLKPFVYADRFKGAADPIAEKADVAAERRELVDDVVATSPLRPDERNNTGSRTAETGASETTDSSECVGGLVADGDGNQVMELCIYGPGGT